MNKLPKRLILAACFGLIVALLAGFVLGLIPLLRASPAVWAHFSALSRLALLSSQSCSAGMFTAEGTLSGSIGFSSSGNGLSWGLGWQFCFLLADVRAEFR